MSGLIDLFIERNKEIYDCFILLTCLLGGVFVFSATYILLLTRSVNLLQRRVNQLEENQNNTSQ